MKPPSGDSHRRLVATCSRGLEEVLATELRALQAAGVDPGAGIVRFEGGSECLWRANLELRTAIRVVASVAEGGAGDRDDLYRLAHEVPWEEWIEPGRTFAVDVAGRNAAFANSGFAALVVKDAIVDRLRVLRGSRPDVSRHRPDIRVHLYLGDGRAEIGIDSTGEPLSHRGYRPRGGPAPLSEALAAGILLLAGYDGRQPLLDPMCGTGTIAIEAALIATRTAPGLRRRFAFERWPFHDAPRYGALRDHVGSARRAAPQPIMARDLEPRAVTATRRNAGEAGVADWLSVEDGDVRELVVGTPGTLIVSNPPYGRRLGRGEVLEHLYRAIGDALKRGAAGSTAWLLIGDPDLIKRVGLRATQRIPLFNGPIECRLVRFDLYEGSRRGSSLE